MKAKLLVFDSSSFALKWEVLSLQQLGFIAFLPHLHLFPPFAKKSMEESFPPHQCTFIASPELAIRNNRSKNMDVTFFIDGAKIGLKSKIREFLFGKEQIVENYALLFYLGADVELMFANNQIL